MKKTTLISIFLIFTIIFAAFIGLFLLTEKNPVFAQYGLEQAESIPGIAKGTIPEYIGGIINAVVAILGSILVALVIYGGVMYMTSAGNEKRTESGKSILTYAVIGIAIVMASYIISSFVLKALGGSGAGETTEEGAAEGQKKCACRDMKDTKNILFESVVPDDPESISKFLQYCETEGGIGAECNAFDSSQ